MKLEVTDVVWLEECAECSLDELAERSRVPAALLRELLDFGVLESRDPAAIQPIFDASVMVTAQTAARLHNDFELDSAGIALALVLMRRISELETQLQRLRAGSSRA
ncbi:MAG: chaperone modulator CbpM [Pseudomonadota bacterium]